jgi:hypothetical protein
MEVIRVAGQNNDATGRMRRHLVAVEPIAEADVENAGRDGVNPVLRVSSVRSRLWIQPVRATHCALSNQRSVADEAKTSDPLHGEPEGADVGALAEG